MGEGVVFGGERPRRQGGKGHREEKLVLEVSQRNGRGGHWGSNKAEENIILLSARQLVVKEAIA